MTVMPNRFSRNPLLQPVSAAERREYMSRGSVWTRLGNMALRILPGMRSVQEDYATMGVLAEREHRQSQPEPTPSVQSAFLPPKVGLPSGVIDSRYGEPGPSGVAEHNRDAGVTPQSSSEQPFDPFKPQPSSEPQAEQPFDPFKHPLDAGPTGGGDRGQ